MAEPTPEQIAAKEKADKIAARVEELKSFTGKVFKRKGDTSPTTYTILEYAGIGVKDGQEYHTFRVERKHPGAIWTPPATKFLEDHEEVSAPESAAANKEVL